MKKYRLLFLGFMVKMLLLIKLLTSSHPVAVLADEKDDLK